MTENKGPDTTARYARVALDLPVSQLGASWFDYALDPQASDPVMPGQWVLVPWGTGRRVGLVVALAESTELDPARVKTLTGPLPGARPAPEPWLRLLRFAADYYHRGLGEVALPAVPKLLRTPPAPRARGSVFDRARARFHAGAEATAPPAPPPRPEPPELNPAQRAALETLEASAGFSVTLLHGVTGSGKTEVYLHWLATVLARDPTCQVLLLVPEIALTPQLAAQVAARFPNERLAILHSDLPDGDRAAHWLAAAEGRARVVIGTRLAVLAPMPGLAAIVVDEEHDPSYKQQEGVRYSARDLAVDPHLALAGHAEILDALLGVGLQPLGVVAGATGAPLFAAVEAEEDVVRVVAAHGLSIIGRGPRGRSRARHQRIAAKGQMRASARSRPFRFASSPWCQAASVAWK